MKKGEACEFEIFVKPLCTYDVHDEDIAVVALDMNKGKQYISNIKLEFKTKLSTRLHPDELIEERKLGEGSFGVVYKGTFRNYTVAIKKMKQTTDNKEQMEEFTKEVSMLDKFRCDYIVHFHGAVFIPSKICMVTEFATFGSLEDLIKHHKIINEQIISINNNKLSNDFIITNNITIFKGFDINNISKKSRKKSRNTRN